MKYCVSVLVTTGDDNNGANSNNIVFTINDTKLYVHAVTLLAKDNKKLSKRLSKRFEDQCIRMNIKQKSENKDATNEHRYFLASNFEVVNRLCFG